MPELQQLHPGHAQAVLAFELANRSYFAAFVSDRGDEFFDRFAEQHSALLAEQEAGASAYYVLVDKDGSVLGRFNLYRFADGTAELGYRVAQHAAGRGLATATVRELCRLAATRHGLRTIRAATSRENTASQKVLAKAGFVPVGPADPAHLGGKQGTWYQRDLAAADAPQQVAMTEFLSCRPNLEVDDLAAAAAFLREVLGFEVEVDEPDMGLVLLRRDAVGLALVRSATPGVNATTAAYIAVTGVDALHAQCAARGARITAGLTDHPWGLRDFVVEVPGGHRLALGERIAQCG